MSILIKPDGSIEFVGDEPTLEALGHAVKRRASRIVPVAMGKRIAFRVLRFVFGDRGRVADWTRRWRGPWRATIIGKPWTFTARTREACLAWERTVIEHELHS